MVCTKANCKLTQLFLEHEQSKKIYKSQVLTYYNTSATHTIKAKVISGGGGGLQYSTRSENQKALWVMKARSFRPLLALSDDCSSFLAAYVLKLVSSASPF